MIILYLCLNPFHPLVAADIAENGIALDRLLVELEHGVDGLGELRTARLVDAACVDPNPLQAVPQSLETAFLDLDESGFALYSVPVQHVLKGNLLISPRVR